MDIHNQNKVKELSNTFRREKEQIIQMKHADNNPSTPIRQQFKKIAIEDKNNSLYLSILNSMNLPTQYINPLKAHITELTTITQLHQYQ